MSDSGKVPMAKRLGREGETASKAEQWTGDCLGVQCERFFISGSPGTRTRSSQEGLGTEADRRRRCLWRAWASSARSRALGSDRLAKYLRIAVGSATHGRTSASGRRSGAAEAERRERRWQNRPCESQTLVRHMEMIRQTCSFAVQTQIDKGAPLNRR